MIGPMKSTRALSILAFAITVLPLGAQAAPQVPGEATPNVDWGQPADVSEYLGRTLMLSESVEKKSGTPLQFPVVLSGGENIVKAVIQPLVKFTDGKIEVQSSCIYELKKGRPEKLVASSRSRATIEGNIVYIYENMENTQKLKDGTTCQAEITRDVFVLRTDGESLRIYHSDTDYYVAR
jgi:hypothetical protein